MLTQSIGKTAQSADNLYAADKTTMGKDDFLKLFVAQLENQDPLSPMESTDFTAQLAQFSSLEQATNTNQKLDYLLLYQSSMNNAQAVNFIGSMVKASGNALSVTEGEASRIQFDLATNAEDVNVYIYDSSNTLVKVIPAGALDKGEQTIEWDGTDENGQTVSDGTYTFEVSARDISGNTVAASTFMTLKVTGATFKDGNAFLLAGDIEISMSDVLEVLKSGDSKTDNA